MPNRNSIFELHAGVTASHIELAETRMVVA